MTIDRRAVVASYENDRNIPLAQPVGKVVAQSTSDVDMQDCHVRKLFLGGCEPILHAHIRPDPAAHLLDHVRAVEIDKCVIFQQQHFGPN